MKPNRFCPSRVRVPDQLEEVLLRILLACFESPVPVLAYLVSLCRRLDSEAIPVEWLDLPLSKLADIVREILSRQKPISANSVAVYIDDLRYQLKQSPTRICPDPNPLRESAFRSDLHWGETALRDYLSHDSEASSEELVLFVARRLGRVRFRWQSQKVFAVFAAARWKDVLIHLRGRHGLDKSTAEELTQETFTRIQRRLSKFNPCRARLIAFTFQEVRFVVREYRKRRRRQNALEMSLEDVNDSVSAVEQILAESAPVEPNPDREAMKLWLTGLLFRLNKPPHQLIVYILCRLLDVPPKKILEKYSGLPLRRVARIAEREFLQITDQPFEFVRAGFNILRARMKQPLVRLVGGEGHRAALGSLATKRAGAIRLAWYFRAKTRGGESKEVTNDWNSVQKALVVRGGDVSGPLSMSHGVSL